MPVIVLEARDFTSPLFLVRTWALLTGCLAYSLVASHETPKPQKTPAHPTKTFHISCMCTWCSFFILTLLIHVLSLIQFHSLIPISWKNLTMTVGALGSLMCLSASITFSWIVMDHHMSPSTGVAAAASCLTFLAYTCEAAVIRSQAGEQKGYMATAPGLLKILQLWGGCQMVPLVVEEAHRLSVKGSGELPSGMHEWQLWVTGTSYTVCLLMSLGSIVVILGDCAGRCLLPFDRLLAGFSLSGVLLYMVANVVCFTKVLGVHDLRQDFSFQLVLMETVLASITLLAYATDLAFSIKLLCDRARV